MKESPNILSNMDIGEAHSKHINEANIQIVEQLASDLKFAANRPEKLENKDFYKSWSNIVGTPFNISRIWQNNMLTIVIDYAKNSMDEAKLLRRKNTSSNDRLERCRPQKPSNPVESIIALQVAFNEDQFFEAIDEISHKMVESKEFEKKSRQAKRNEELDWLEIQRIFTL